MKGFVAVLLSFGLAASAIASEADLASQLFHPSPIALALADGGVTAPSRDAATPQSGDKNPSDLKPGRALMLSAIIPGAGEYYAGKKLRAAAFFAIEVAAWAGVIYYYNKGQDEDKKFKSYANSHFFERVYRDYEFQLAQNPAYGDSGAFTGTFDEWTAETWDYKIHYLPDRGFTHELPDGQDRANQSMDQQYYEMIGKYIHQYGFGWDDVFLGSPGAVTGFLGDDPATPNYDNQNGAAKRSAHYMDMRYASNNYLDNSAIAIQIAMLNHVASALDASFTVQAMKRKAKAQVGFRPIRYDDHQVAVGGLNFSW